MSSLDSCHDLAADEGVGGQGTQDSSLLDVAIETSPAFALLPAVFPFLAFGVAGLPTVAVAILKPALSIFETLSDPRDLEGGIGGIDRAFEGREAVFKAIMFVPGSLALMNSRSLSSRSRASSTYSSEAILISSRSGAERCGSGEEANRPCG